MPEMHFQVRWPDGTSASCYSPSLVVKDYLEVGATYTVDDFRSRARTALSIASDRVMAKYGFACSGALDQLALIESTCNRFIQQADARILIESFDP